MGIRVTLSAAVVFLAVTPLAGGSLADETGQVAPSDDARAVECDTPTLMFATHTGAPRSV